MSSSTGTTPVVTPFRMMQGHTSWVNGIVHLHGRQHIITCSYDDSLRLWDLESGTQLGEDWRDDNTGVRSIALSPNGETVASGHYDGQVRLWDIETRKVIAKWEGHTNCVGALCWRGDGKQVLSGSWDGTARTWYVKSGKTVLAIETGHDWVNAVVYSPDATKIATGGGNENAVKIWNAKTGKLFKTLEQHQVVWSLAWTSDGKKLISSSFWIRIFDTTTWQQIAVLGLKGHIGFVKAICLSRNERFLASASVDQTARLWNLDTNLPIGLPLQHENGVGCAALSPDGKVLVTGCRNKHTYTWDVHAILKKAGLEDLLPNIEASQGNSGVKRTPRSSIDDKSFLEADATRPCRDEFGGVDEHELPPRFFDDMGADDSSPMGGAHPHPSSSTLLVRLSSLLHRFRPNNAEATEFPQPLMPFMGIHPRVIFARLSSLIHHSPPENEPNELQQPSTPSRSDINALLTRLSSLWPHSRPNTDGEIEPHPTARSGSRPDAIIGLLTSLFRSQPRTNEEIEPSQYSRHPRVVEVAAVRDREVIFTAPPPPQKMQQQTQSHAQGSSTTPPAPGTNSTTSRPKHPHSLPVRLLAHLVLFLCCASPQHANTNAQPTQQQQGQIQTQASSSRSQPAAPSTSTTLPAPAPSNAVSGAATMHS